MAIKDLYSPDEPLGSLAESVCARPKMYTINGTLEEVGAFLEGFYSGMASHNHSEGAGQEVLWWAECLNWACCQLGGERGGWYTLFRLLRSAFVNDEDGFERLAALLIQYRREHPNAP